MRTQTAQTLSLEPVAKAGARRRSIGSAIAIGHGTRIEIGTGGIGETGEIVIMTAITTTIERKIVPVRKIEIGSALAETVKAMQKKSVTTTTRNTAPHAGAAKIATANATVTTIKNLHLPHLPALFLHPSTRPRAPPQTASPFVELVSPRKKIDSPQNQCHPRLVLARSNHPKAQPLTVIKTVETHGSIAASPVSPLCPRHRPRPQRKTTTPRSARRTPARGIGWIEIRRYTVCIRARRVAVRIPSASLKTSLPHHLHPPRSPRPRSAVETRLTTTGPPLLQTTQRRAVSPPAQHPTAPSAAKATSIATMSPICSLRGSGNMLVREKGGEGALRTRVVWRGSWRGRNGRGMAGGGRRPASSLIAFTREEKDGVSGMVVCLMG